MNNHLKSDINKAWLEYIDGGNINSQVVRAEVIESWQRSSSYQVNPYQEKVDDILRLSKLKSIREQNELLISHAEPRMKELAKSLFSSDAVVTMSDSNGVIINTFGNQNILHKSENIGLVPGSIWNEEVAGTNAVGVVLKTKQPSQILYSEHYSTGWHTWSSTAAPIFHPYTNELIGVYDIAGTFKNVSEQTKQLVKLKTQIIMQDLFKQMSQETIINNSYLQTVLQSTSDGILLLDRDKQIINFNKTMNHFFEKYCNTILFNNNTITQMVDVVLRGDLLETKDKILIENQEYLITVSAVKFDQKISGIIIVLREVNKKQPIKNKLKNKQKILYNFNDIIGDSKIMKELIVKAKKAAQLDMNLFISGETGTGKEVFAQAIHHASYRCDKPFIAVNCGAIAKDLIESELFGYEAGAFTGARTEGKKGKFEQANGGTLFLDEIGDMPLDVQVRVLRAIEERLITRLGGSKEINLDIRVISATHKNLYKETLAQNFREDLYYRLHVINLSLPPLHKRGHDILLIANHYLKMYEQEYAKKDCIFSDEVKSIFLQYDWPGNVRELRNIIQQILFNSKGQIIEKDYLPHHLYTNHKEKSQKSTYVELILDYRGDMDAVAEKLNISRATLYRRLQKYNLTKTEILKQADN